MSKVVIYKTLESAKQAADTQFNQFGWFVAVVPIWREDGKVRLMLQSSASDDMVYSVGKEEGEQFEK